MLRRNFSPLFLILALAGFFLGTAPVQAHDVLIGSTPEDGAELDQAPAEAVLTFSAAPLDVSPQAVLQRDGETIETEPVALSGNDVILPLPELEAGSYTIIYSVVSSDGHRIDGTTSFSVTIGAQTAEETTSEAATTEASPSEAETTAPAPAETVETSDSEDSAVGWIRWAGIIIVVLGGFVIVSRMLRNR